MPNNERLDKILFMSYADAMQRPYATRISAAGLSDISWNELLVLAALYLGRQAETDLRQELEFSSGAADEMTGKLVLHGYLEYRANPDDPDRTMITFTRRAAMALFVVRQGIRADR